MQCLAGARMPEPELPRVKHLARPASRSAIRSISENRMADMLEVDPDLVGAPGVQLASQQRTAGKISD